MSYGAYWEQLLWKDSLLQKEAAYVISVVFAAAFVKCQLYR